MFRWEEWMWKPEGVTLSRGCSGCHSSRSRDLWLRYSPRRCLRSGHSSPPPVEPVHFWSSHKVSSATSKSTTTIILGVFLTSVSLGRVGRLVVHPSITTFKIYFNQRHSMTRALWYSHSNCGGWLHTYREGVEEDIEDMRPVLKWLILSDDKGVVFIG